MGFQDPLYSLLHPPLIIPVIFLLVINTVVDFWPTTNGTLLTMVNPPPYEAGLYPCCRNCRCQTLTFPDFLAVSSYVIAYDLGSLLWTHFSQTLNHKIETQSDRALTECTVICHGSGSTHPLSRGISDSIWGQQCKLRCLCLSVAALESCRPVLHYNFGH